MTLKQFIDMIGGYTDETMKVQIRYGMNEIDEGRLYSIRARLKNKHYLQEYEGWKVAFFNIIDNWLLIYMVPVQSRKKGN